METIKKVTETPVLIVGAGPVGLGLALDLAWRGVSCVLIEQGDGSISTPKLGAIGVRTMEFCRRWGIAERIRQTPFRRNYKLDMVFCTTISGHLLARHSYPSLAEDAAPPESPEQKWRCPQLWFDPLLASCVKQYKEVDLRYRIRYDHFTQDGDKVTVSVTNLETGEAETIVADYLVGCDGAGSRVRKTMGIEMQGRRALDHSAAIFFRSSALIKSHDKGEAERYLLVGANGFWGNVSAMDGHELWRLTVISNEQEVEQVCTDAQEWVRRAIGDDNVPFEVISAMPWRRSQLTAPNYRQGRVLLCGDSGHTMSPTGGFGMNTGMGDAVDLGWKLQALLQGWGGEGLLDSYTRERQPVGVRNVNASAGNYFALKSVSDCSAIHEVSPAGEAVRKQVGTAIAAATHTEWETLGIHLGYRYDDSPICIPDGTPADEDSPRYYVPTTRPGHRLPHAWMDDGRSTLDLLGRGFVLIRTNASLDVAEFEASAKRARLPLTVVDIDSPEIAKLYERALVLVRPDGHCAWRGDSAPENPEEVIDIVRGCASQVARRAAEAMHMN